MSTDLAVLKDMLSRARIKFDDQPDGQLHWLEVTPKHTGPVVFWFHVDGSLKGIEGGGT